MAQIGRMNKLEVVREVGFGVYLDGDDLGGILLPKRYVPEGCKLGDRLDVFVYMDSEEFPIAITDAPLVQLGQAASLKVVSVEKVGVFLDWGLPKDLFLPYSEIRSQHPEVGQHVMVYVYLDNTNRICASARLDRFLDKTPADYKRNQQVELVIAAQTDLGYKAVVDGTHWGVLYHDEVFRKLRRGYKTRGFIKQVRPDGKIDLSLDKPGYAKVDRLQQKILQYLDEHNGYSPLNDKSQPEQIYSTYGISKKAYKMAIGGLYRQRLITIDEDGIRLVEGN